MAVGHITFSPSNQHGGALRKALDSFESGFQELRATLLTMVQMQDGGSSTSYIVDQYGFTSTATADAAVAELGAMVGKLTSDASQTNVFAAINQCLAKLR